MRGFLLPCVLHSLVLAGQLLIVLYDRSCERKFIDVFVSGNNTEADEGVDLRHAQALTVSSASEIVL
jgi:hypothetical protein